MPVRVATGFVSLFDDSAHQLRIALRYPTQYEKRGLDARLIEQIQEPLGARFHAAGKGAPLAPVHNVGKRFDMKIIFNVNGYDIATIHSFLAPPGGLPVQLVSLRGNSSRSASQTGRAFDLSKDRWR